MTNRSYAEVVLDRLGRSLRREADVRRAAGMSSYMRGRFAFFGVPAPAQRRIARQAAAGLGDPGEDELLALALSCWARPEREWQQVACRYLADNATRCSARALSVVEGLITHKSWWDTVDTLASHTVGTLVSSHPELVADMDRWVHADDYWLVRAALLHQLKYKAATDPGRLFSYCELRASDPEFFVRKAIGWALREYSKTDPAAVAGFVADHGDQLSSLSAREALRLLSAGHPRPSGRGR